MNAFPELFNPGKIGALETKNRIVFAPMVTRYVTPEGGITQRMIDYYVARAEGGAGLIVVEAAYPRASGYPGRIYLNDDSFVSGLKKLVEAVHNAGAGIVAEVNIHRGRADEFDPASASPVKHPVTGTVPRQLSIEDIRKLEDDFARGISRVMESGFDAVMLHGGTGYLVAEFLTPLVNFRTDEYGGDLRRRARLLLELVDITRKVAGPGFPVIQRLTADDKLPGGFGPPESISVCSMLQEHGVDAIDIVAGSQETTHWTFPSLYMPEGCNADLAASIKHRLHIPVFVAGKIITPGTAERILENKQADFVDMGRALLADPDLPRKTMTGEVDEIRQCLTCQRCLEIMTIQLKPVKCTVNPAAGSEREWARKTAPAIKKKKVLVIGSGPGGMAAAVTAALRGHNVTLWEIGNVLGGQLNVASVPPGKTHLRTINDYFQRQLLHQNVSVELNKTATPTDVKSFAPDALIVAIGSVPFVPDIPGIDNRIVVDCRRVLAGHVVTGKTVVIIGGGLIACETADALTEQGKDVTLAFPETAALSLEIVDRSITNVLLQRLKDRNVVMVDGVTQFSEISGRGLRLTDKNGNDVLLEADSIVLAAGSRPDRRLIESLACIVPETYEVGDCVQVGRLLEAIHGGTEAGTRV